MAKLFVRSGDEGDDEMEPRRALPVPSFEVDEPLEDGRLPATAEEYMRMVSAEARRIPDVVRVHPIPPRHPTTATAWDGNLLRPSAKQRKCAHFAVVITKSKLLCPQTNPFVALLISLGFPRCTRLRIRRHCDQHL